MRLDKSFISIVIVLIIAGGLSMVLYLRKPVEVSSVRVSDLPMDIAEWKGDDILLDERTYAILETKNVTMRKYRDPGGRSIYLYVVVSEANRRVAHPPEVCYTGDGLEIAGKEQVRFRVPGLKDQLLVNSFISSKGKDKALVYYWYKSGDKFTAHYMTQQAKAALNQLMGKDTVAALIRVSTPINNNDKEEAAQTLQEFSKKLMPLILEYTP